MGNVGYIKVLAHHTSRFFPISREPQNIPAILCSLARPAVYYYMCFSAVACGCVLCVFSHSFKTFPLFSYFVKVKYPKSKFNNLISINTKILENRTMGPDSQTSNHPELT